MSSSQQEEHASPHRVGPPPPFFFADATLDLDEAHDIADTPEAAQHKMVAAEGLAQLKVPNLFLPAPPLPLFSSLNADDNGVTTADGPQQHRVEADDPPLPLNHMRSIAPPMEQQYQQWNVASSSSRKQKWPRDIYWTLAFLLIVPISMLYPIFKTNTPTSIWAQHPLSFATLHSITWTFLVVLLLLRTLYRSPTTEADRHQATQMLLALAPGVVALHLTLALLLAGNLSHYYYTGIPIAAALQQVLALRHTLRPSVVLTRRWAWFSALSAVAALDLLQRHRRRGRPLMLLLLLLQGGALLLWRAALLCSGNIVALFMLLLIGQWLAATLRSGITYVVCASIWQWALENATAVEEPRLSTTNGASRPTEGSNDASSVNSTPSIHSIPEAYRTVDASVYQSVCSLDDVWDDDEADDEEDTELSRMILSPADVLPSAGRHAPLPPPRTIMKSMLWTGLTIRFGSIVQAGFWSDWQLVGKKFLPPYADYAMTQVALPDHPGYLRAAREVSMRIAQTGLEPILQEDMSAAIVSAVTGTLSGLIVLITTALLLHQRRGHPEVTDHHVVGTMCLSFLLAHALIRTALEPLRTAIQASYITFAMHPQLFLQNYPLIYHRLHRLTSSSNNNNESNEPALQMC